MSLVLFSGGYSLGTSLNRIELESGTKYLLEGTQKLFLIADTAEDSTVFTKPYFTLQMKKVRDVAGATSESSETAMTNLDDTSILASTITVNPLMQTLETVHETVKTVEIYASIVEERET